MRDFDPRQYVGQSFYSGDRLVLVIEAGFLHDKSGTPYLRYSGITMTGEREIKWFIEHGEEPRP